MSKTIGEFPLYPAFSVTGSLGHVQPQIVLFLPREAGATNSPVKHLAQMALPTAMAAAAQLGMCLLDNDALSNDQVKYCETLFLEQAFGSTVVGEEIRAMLESESTRAGVYDELHKLFVAQVRCGQTTPQRDAASYRTSKENLSRFRATALIFALVPAACAISHGFFSPGGVPSKAEQQGQADWALS